jgi:hypothetical protein
MVERDESIEDLEIRCTNHGLGIILSPDSVQIVTIAGTDKIYFSLDCKKVI